MFTFTVYGRMTKEPKVINLQNGTKTEISIASDDGNKNKSSALFNMTAFGKLGETIANYIHCGQRIICSGVVTDGSYNNNEGKKIYKHNFIVNSFEFVETLKDTQEHNQNDLQQTPSQPQQMPQQMQYQQMPPQMQYQQMPPQMQYQQTPQQMPQQMPQQTLPVDDGFVDINNINFDMPFN